MKLTPINSAEAVFEAFHDPQISELSQWSVTGDGVPGFKFWQNWIWVQWAWEKPAPDGRLVVVFRDTNRASPTNGDWCAWVGTYDDLVHGRLGQYRVRLMHSTWGWDCGYSGLHVLGDGTFVATSYGHWIDAEEPYIVSVRFKLAELDTRLGSQEHPAPSAR